MDNQENWLRSVLASIGDGVIAADVQGRVVLLNSAASALTGCSPDEANGRPLEQVFRLVDRATRRAVTLPSRFGDDDDLVARDGTARPVEGSFATIRDDQGTATGCVVVFRETSRPPPLDRDLRRDDFLAMLAHELRNPLAPISNGLAVLSSPSCDSRLIARAREMMERQVHNLTRIVDDLLAVSRLTRGRIALRTERLDLRRLAHEAVEDHQAQFDSCRVAVELSVPESPAWVVGDPMRLGQVLDNLLDNAAKFTGPDGRVTVRLEADEDERTVRLVVRDTGVGIDQDLLPRLFNVFAQHESGLDRSGGGLGLGLALVKGLVELHGGTVSAASAGSGCGAEFTLALPAAVDACTANRSAGGSPPRPRRRLRILVVEDNRDSAESLRLLLQMFGHEVSVAYSGPEGVQAAKRWHPDVMLCDIGLPGLDGYGVVGELRRDPETAGTRAIAVTGYGGEEDRRRSQQAGFDLHLVKPADPEQLRDLLKGLNGGAA
jgi:PAS domain S-box-containing protein